MTLNRRVSLVLVVPALLAGRADAKKTPPCAGARYVVTGAPVVSGGSALAPDTIVIGSTISIGSGCAPVRVKLKGSKKGTTVSAVWPKGCAGAAGKVTLGGKIDAACQTLTAKVRGKKAKLKRDLTATRSSCGDGVFDPGGESCDAGAGCSGVQACGATCSCGGGGGPNAQPSAALDGPTTGTAGTPVVFDGRASADPDGDPLSHTWEFGDGTRGGGERATHVFHEAGTFTVRLTVGDGRGGAGSTTRAIAVAAGPTPGAEVQATGTVYDVGGAAIGGASVTVDPGGATGTTNAQGKVTVGIRKGVPSQVHVRRSGYADQIVGTQVTPGAEDAIFEATLLRRESPLTLDDAAVGGTLAGKDGARLELPPNALVDEAGNPVTGEVEVQVTPLDVTEKPRAFPGRCRGVGPDGTDGIIITYGTVEYALEQDGNRLNLKPGSAATIEIPVYADARKDGTPVNVGDTFPLWSLDERTGNWVAEATGTVVQSAASPSGLALRGPVTHFSWWNHDDFDFPPAKPKPRCLVDTNADGILEDLTGTGHCWHGGTGPEQPGNGGGRGRALERARRIPQYRAEIELPAAGGVELPIPADMDILFRSRAKGGTLVGQKLVRLGPNVSADVDIVLHPFDGPTTPIDPLPHSQEYDLPDDGRVFTFVGQPNDLVWVSVQESSNGGGATKADMFLAGPGDLELGPVQFDAAFNRNAQIGVKLSAQGIYRITVLPTRAGTFRLVVTRGSGAFPWVRSTVPAPGATGVAATTNLAVTYSQAVTSPRVLLGNVLAGTYFDAIPTGATATVTPPQPLLPGVTYRVTASGARDVTTNFLQAPTEYEWTFTVAEQPGALVPLARGTSSDRLGGFDVAVGPGGVAHAAWRTYFTAGSSGNSIIGGGYRAGVGWTEPTKLRGVFYDGSDPAVAVDGQGVGTAIWGQRKDGPGGAGGPFGIWSSRRLPDGEWSAPATIDPVAETFPSAVVAAGADPAGNVIAVWSQPYASPKRIWWNRFVAGTGWGTAAAIGDGDLPFERQLVVSADGTALLSYQDAARHWLVRRFTPAGGWGAATDFGDRDVHVATNATGIGFVYVDSPTPVAYRFQPGPTPAWCATPPWCSLPAVPTGLGVAYAVAMAPDGSLLAAIAKLGYGLGAVRHLPDATGQTAGSWTVVQDVFQGSAGSVHLGMDALGNAVLVWKPLTDFQGDPPLAFKRYRVTTGWSATATVPEILQNPLIRLGVGPGGEAIVLSSFGSLLHAVRLP